MVKCFSACPSECIQINGLVLQVGALQHYFKRFEEMFFLHVPVNDREINAAAVLVFTVSRLHLSVSVLLR